MVDEVFKALADVGRRQLLDQLYERNGQTLGELCAHLKMSRQGATKHLNILRKANLIIPLWRGRRKLHYLNPAPLKQAADDWVSKYADGENCLRALRDLEEGLEAQRRL